MGTTNHKNRNVLIIDDNDAINYFNELILRNSKMFDDIKSMTSCTKGLRYIESLVNTGDKLPDIILLDINMPIMTGWEFCEKLKTNTYLKNTETQVYILTNSLDWGDEQKPADLTFVKGFIQKPLNTRNISKIAC